MRRPKTALERMLAAKSEKTDSTAIDAEASRAGVVRFGTLFRLVDGKMVEASVKPVLQIASRLRAASGGSAKGAGDRAITADLRRRWIEAGKPSLKRAVDDLLAGLEQRDPKGYLAYVGSGTPEEIRYRVINRINKAKST